MAARLRFACSLPTLSPLNNLLLAGSLPSAAVDIWMQGSSLTLACSKSNCYKMPLGFVGQAVIIAGTQCLQRLQGAHCCLAAQRM